VFYSKDFLYEYLIVGCINKIIIILFLFRVGLTRAYCFKRIICVSTFSLKRNSFFVLFERNLIIKRVIFLFLGRLLNGSFIGWLMFPNGVFVCISYLNKLMSFIFILLGILFGVFINKILLKLFLLGRFMFYIRKLRVQGGWKNIILKSLSLRERVDLGFGDLYGKNLFINRRRIRVSFLKIEKLRIILFLIGFIV